MEQQATVEVGRLTVTEIIAGLTSRRDEAPPAKKAHWARLIGLAEELQELQSRTALTSQRWMITECTIANFRGISEPLRVEFGSEADVMVLHGENGSGKSSVTAAIRMAIEGAIGVTHAGAPIKAAKALWVSSDERHQGAGTATVEVKFRATGDSGQALILKAEYNGSLVSRTARIDDGVGGIINIAANDESWLSWDAAVRAAPPVFAYSELADELKARSDLQAWILKCLAMDAASVGLNAAVSDSVDSATAARKRMIAQIERTTALAATIDSQAAADGVVIDEEIDWAALWDAQSLDQWRDDNGLEDWVSEAERLPTSLVSQVAEFLEVVRAQVSRWNEASSHLVRTDVARLFTDLNAAVCHSNQGDNGGICPFCGEIAPGWRENLERQAKSFEGANKAWAVMKRLLLSSVEPTLKPLLSAANSIERDDEPQGASDARVALTTACDRLLSIAREDESDVGLVDAISSLDGAWTAIAKQTIDVVVSRSDRRASWRAERLAAARELFDVWYSDIELARSREDWVAARNLWNPFLAALRNDRALKLESQFSRHLRAMLEDVGIDLQRLNVKKNDTEIELVDSQGNSVELSYLSAGQRNALILAPVLAQSGIGLFEFILLDDPVHAFDEFRVDRLAATLVRLGAERPLIITTHDGRFVEYLRAHLPERYSVVRVRRVAGGQIELTESGSPWSVLFDHAAGLLEQAANVSSDGARDICALLRMGFDSALESFVYRAVGRRAHIDRKPFLEAFSSAFTTDRRLELARNLASSQARFDAAVSDVRSYLRVWSAAVHEVAPMSGSLAEQLQIARRSARALAKL